MRQPGRRPQLLGVGGGIAEFGGIPVGETVGQVGLEPIGEVVDLVGSEIRKRRSHGGGELRNGGRGKGCGGHYYFSPIVRTGAGAVLVLAFAAKSRRLMVEANSVQLARCSASIARPWELIP